ncbi:MAG TPA: nucleotide exchange factor GrpE [Chthonomonadales bacterium]|nr:nucleotide exchange factor GrpE [Chthonomonadales bacterium]
MRKKIQVNANDTVEQEAAASPAPDAAPPEFSNHVNAPESKPAVDAAGANGPVGGKDGDPDGGAATYVVALQAELEEARKKADEFEKALLYAQAEFQNFRRRQREEQEEFRRYVKGEQIKSLLPVLDSFERALKAAEQSRNFDALIAGVSGTLKQLQAFLEKAGVKPIEAVGKEFDPNFHEAVGHSEHAQAPENLVTEEIQKGYLLHDRVLRPSLVKVSSG